MKTFVKTTFLSSLKDKLSNIPISAGIEFSWDKFPIKVTDSNGNSPYGEKWAEHIFAISIGVFYWSYHITFYKPIPEDK